MTKTSALKVGSKLEWYHLGSKSERSLIMTVTHITKGKIYVEYVNDWGYPVKVDKDDWSRRELNRTLNIEVLSV